MRNAAGSLQQRSAVRDADSFLHGIIVHIVEHDDIGFCLQRLPQLVECAHLNLNAHHMSDMLPELRDCRQNAAAGINMIVLQHGAVREIEAVIFAAAAAHGIFLHRTDADHTLARVGNRSICACNDINASACFCCNAGEMLQEIERRAFALEQRARSAVHDSENIAVFDAVAVFGFRGKADAFPDQFKHTRSDFHAAEDAFILCHEIGVRFMHFVQQKIGRYIHSGDILMQRTQDHLIHIRLQQLHYNCSSRIK